MNKHDFKFDRIYNLKRQKTDKRDKSLKVLLDPHAAVQLPPMVDLRSKCPAVYNQLALGSCSANAGVAARVMLDNLQVQLSRLDLYYLERKIEGTIKKDSGAQMRDIGKALQTYGVCEEQFFPYDITKFTNTPSVNAISNAINYKITSYHAVASQTEIKQNIALKQQPVLVGIDVYESFESATVEKTGIVPMPKKGEQMLGGHAVCCVGYDDTKKVFIMRNSWGANWGQAGYFVLPYTYFTKGFAYDFWALQK